MRIGFGYDVHRLKSGRKLMLGGVEVPNAEGLAGHSDADVLLHAVIDALLGAACLGDIGAHFPPGDPAWKDVSSMRLLAHTVSLLTDHDLAVANVDSTIVCQSPRLAPYIIAMRENIAAGLGCGVGRVSVKATTEEGLGFTGDSSGIKAYAVALLEEPGR